MVGEVVSLEISPASPTLTVGTQQQLTATAVLSDGARVNVTAEASWTSSAPTVADLTTGAGLARALTAGTTTITVNFSGKTASTLVTVTAAGFESLRITPMTASLKKGATQQYTATGVRKDASEQDLTNQVMWSSSNATSASISPTGLVSALGEGAVTITAALGGVQATSILTVTEPQLLSLQIAPGVPLVAVGHSQQLIATGTYDDTSTQVLTDQVTWTSADHAVATVGDMAGQKGLLAGITVGMTSVTVSFKGVMASANVTVNASPIKTITVSPTSPMVPKGLTQQFAAEGTFENGSMADVTNNVLWGSGDPSVTIDGMGLAHAANLGMSIITASSGTVDGTAIMTVLPPVLVSMEVLPANPSRPKGVTLQFAAIGTYSDLSTDDLTTSVSWASSGPAVSIAVGGLATADALGMSDITAALGMLSASTTMTVTPAELASIKVTPNNPLVPKNVTQQFVATGTWTDATTQIITGSVTWGSTDPQFATIDAAGLAKGIAVGMSTISATQDGITGSTVINVIPAALVSIALMPGTPTKAKGLTQQFTAIGTYADASMQDISASVTWSTSNANVSINANGLATADAVGTSDVSATFGAVSGSTTMTVTPAELVAIMVTPPAPFVAKGLQQQMRADGVYTDTTIINLTATVMWSSMDTNKVTIVPGGLASAANVGTSMISASQDGVTGTTLMTVEPAALVSLAITPPAPFLAKGRTQQLTATGTYTDNSMQNLSSTVTWHSTDTSKVTVSATGLVGAANLGASSITASAGGVNTSTTVTVTPAELVSLAVTPVTPSLAKGLTQQFMALGTYTDTTTQDLTATVTWASSDPSKVGIVPGGLATAAQVGPSNISATSGSISDFTTMTVTPAVVVSIAVTPDNPLVAKGLQQQFTALATYSDGAIQNVTNSSVWSSTDITKVTINASGLANAVAVGNSTIRATQAGIVGQTGMTVSPGEIVSIAVTPGSPSKAKGLTQQFTATATYTDASTQDITASVVWSSNNTSAVTIVAGGLATAANLGMSTISATLSGKTGTATMSVTPEELVSIAVTPAMPSKAKGQSQQFVATGTYTDATTQILTGSAMWASSDITKVTIVAGGLATAANVGTSTISATSGSITGSTTMSVTPAELVSIAVTPATPSKAKGQTQQFVATGTYTDNSTQDITATVVWASLDTSKVTITAAGLATAANVGTSTVSATSGAIAGSTVMTVTPAALVSIAVTPATPSRAKGQTQQFVATGTYTDNSTAIITGSVTWASMDTTKVTITAAGLATAANVGTSTVSATSGAISGSTLMTVTPATIVSVAVTPVTPSKAKGLTQQFTAIATYTDNSTQDLTSTVTWSSSDTSKVTIAVGGLANAVNVGTSTISALAGAASGSTVMTVTPAALVSIAVTPPTPSKAKGLTQQFTATGTYSDNSTQDLTATATWASSNTTAVTITAAGLATAANIGSSFVSATHTSIVGQATMTVTPATLVSIAVTPPMPTKAKGLTQQFTATGTYTDNTTSDLTASVSWSSSDTSKVSIAAGGLATAANVGSSTISALSGAISGSTSMSVTPAELLSLAVTPAGQTIAKGLQQQYTATGTYTDASQVNLTASVTWGSTNTSVATLTAGGLATVMAATGSTTISATSGLISGSTTLSAAPANLVSIAVTPATPTVPKGATQQFVATGTYSDATQVVVTGTVTWGSSNTSAATITSGGLATAQAASGTSTITATFGMVSGTATLTAAPAAVVSITVTPPFPSIYKGTLQQFVATANYSDGTTQSITNTATWSSSVQSFATVNSSGLANGVGAGTTTISATSGGITGSTDLLVLPNVPQVTGVFVLSSTTLRVIFSEEVKSTATSDGATLLSNYCVEVFDQAPANCTQTSDFTLLAVTSVDNKTYDITLSAAPLSKVYTLKVANITDPQGNVVTNPDYADFIGVDSLRVISATALSTTTVELFFSKAVTVGPNTAGSAGCTSAVECAKRYKVFGASSLGSITSAVVQGGAQANRVVLTHSSAQLGGVYTIAVANNNDTDGFVDSSWGSITVFGGGENVQAKPNDRSSFSGLGGVITLFSDGPLFSDPFGDGTTFANVFKYRSKLYIGTSGDGKGAVRANGDGSQPELVTFAINKDTSSAGGSTSSNTSAGPYTGFGFSGCSANTTCGPDNEDGRGIFTSGTINGTEWLVVGGGRSGRNLDYVYMSSDADDRLSFKYVDLTDTTDNHTAGFSAMTVFNNRVYFGFPDAGGPDRPHLSMLASVPGSGSTGLDTTANGSNPCNVASHSACYLEANEFPSVGFKASPKNNAQTQLIDFFGEFNDKLYLGNNGGLMRSTNSTPLNYGDYASHWTNITPTAAAYTAKTSYETSKEADLEPADKAWPQMAVYNSMVFLGRNTTSGPQLWKCTPGADGDCDPADWSLIAANSTGDTQLSQFNNTGNTRITMLVVNGTYLYVGYDNATSGVVIYRTSVANPTNRSDFRGLNDCDASMNGCAGIGGNGFGSTNNTRIWNAVSLLFGNANYLYIATGNGVVPLSVYRTTN